MPKKKYSAEDIIHKLREADVLLGQGSTVAEVCKQLSVTDQTYHRWRKAYGGMTLLHGHYRPFRKRPRYQGKTRMNVRC